MAVPRYYANGVELLSLGFRVDGPIGSRRQLLVQPDITRLARSTGGFLASVSGAQRRLGVTGTIVGTSWATGEAAQDALLDLLTPGVVVFEEQSDSRRLVLDSVLDGQPSVTQFRPSFRQVAASFAFTLLAIDGLWRAQNGTPVAVPNTNSRYSLPQGTAPASLVIRLMGAATNPTVTIRGADGQALSALAFTVTLTSSEWLDIDGERGVIEKVSSGVRTNAVSLLTSGTFPVPLTLGAWNFAASTWPTVEVSAGSAEVLYTPRYW